MVRSAMDGAAQTESMVLLHASAASELATRIELMLIEGGYSVVPVPSLRTVHEEPKGLEVPIVAAFEHEPAETTIQEMLELQARGAPVLCLLLAPSRSEASTELERVGLRTVVDIPEPSTPDARRVLELALREVHHRRMLELARKRAEWVRDAAEAFASEDEAEALARRAVDAFVAFGARSVAFLEGTPPTVVVAKGSWQAALEPGTELALTGPPRLRCEWGPSARTMVPDIPVSETSTLGCLPVGTSGYLLVELDQAPLPTRQALADVTRLFARGLERAASAAASRRRIDRLGRLMATVGHDVRGPLTAIRAHGDELASAPDPEIATMGRDLLRAGHRANLLAQDLLTLAAPGQRGTRLARRSIDLTDTLRSAIDDIRVGAKRGHTFDLAVPPGRTEALVDPHRLAQVFGNLLGNAVQYAPPDTLISVTLRADPDAAYIEIHNRGRTLGRREAALAFEPFERLQAAERPGRVGLGMFIVQRIVEAHGGATWIEPGDPDGTRVCVRLPRADAHEREIDLLDTAPRHRPPWRPPPWPEAYRALKDRFHCDALGDTLELWLEAGGHAGLPHPERLDRVGRLALAPDLAHVRVHRYRGEAPLFEYLEVGARLQRWLHRSLDGTFDRDGQSLHYEAYLAAYTQARPHYDYLKLRKPEPMRFERLVLPLRRGPAGPPTDLLAAAVFDLGGASSNAPLEGSRP